jgi:hypothetical protein
MMYAALLHARRQQQRLVDDGIVADAPKPRETRIGALTAHDDLHAETLYPQTQRLIHIGDAQRHVGIRLGVGWVGWHEKSLR